MANYLSFSRVETLMRCPREYVFKYILEYKEPSDSKALTIGKAFHHLCEGKEVTTNDFQGLDADYPWLDSLRVMFAGYQAERSKHPEAIAFEVDIETDDSRLVVDEIAMGADERWWIVERKTRTKADPLELQQLAGNLQILLYAGHHRELADRLMTDAGKFQGVLYARTFKPGERMKKGESIADFGKRLTSSTDITTVSRWEIAKFLPALQSTMMYAQKQRELIESMFANRRDPRQMPGNCAACYGPARYHSACPFFDKCHGGQAPIAAQAPIATQEEPQK